MSGGMQSAIVHFPAYSFIIKSKCNSDEEFQILCDDLAEAELVLLELEKSSPARDERLLEYRELVEGLLAEVAAAIGVGRVIPIRGPEGR